MFNHHIKSVILILFAFLVSGCESKTAPIFQPIEPTDTSIPAVREATQVKAPEAKPLPTKTPTNELMSTETATAQPESILPKQTWKVILGGPGDDTLQNFIMDEDGGTTIVGSTNLDFNGEMAADIYLIKTDANGEAIWEETYGSGGYHFAQTLYSSDVEGFLVAGVISSAETQGQDIFALQLDQDRNELWTKFFGGPLDEFGTVWPLEDGGYVLGGNLVDPNNFVADPGVAGYGGFEGRSNIYIAKVDPEGNELWSRTFGGDDNVITYSAAPTKDGGFIILGNIVYFPETGDDILLVRVDQDGNEVWSRTWEEGNLNGNDIIQTSDGGFLIAGSTSTGDDPANLMTDYFFIKLDPDGHEIWSTSFGDPNMIDFSKVILETQDGSFVGAGEYTKDYYGSPSDISLVKLDADGQLVWEKRIPMATHNMFGNILQHPDGGFVIGGSTVNRGQFDIFLIKTDAEGNVE